MAELKRVDLVRASDLAIAALNPHGVALTPEMVPLRLNDWSKREGIGPGLLNIAALQQRDNAARLLQAGITPSSLIPSMYLTGFLNGWFAHRIADEKAAERITADHPDYDLVRARAFQYAIDRSKFTAPFIDEAMEAGQAALAYERRKAGASESETAR